MITRFKIKACLLLLMLAVAARVQAQEPVSLSLQECIDYAMKHADTIKNVRLNILRQEAQNNQIRALALPQISATGILNYYPNPQQALVPAGIFDGGKTEGYVPVQFTPSWGSTVTLSGSQPIFDGTLLVALKARNTIMDVVRQVAQLTEEGLKYQIQRAYFSIVIAHVQQKNLTNSLFTAREMARDLEAMYSAGFVEKIEVDRSNVQLTNMETDSLRSATMLEVVEQALKYTIGMDISQPIILTDTSLTENLRDATALLTEQLDYTRRTEYNLIHSSLKLDEAQLKRYQLAALPTLRLNANTGYNYGSNGFAELTQTRNYLFSTFLGLQLNVPIFTGLLRTNQVKEARINIEKTQNNIHQLKLGLDYQAAQSHTTLKNALLAAEMQKRNLALANTVLDLAHKKYKAGVGSNLEVSVAQTALLFSQNNYYSAMLDVVNAQADAQRAFGLLP